MKVRRICKSPADVFLCRYLELCPGRRSGQVAVVGRFGPRQIAQRSVEAPPGEGVISSQAPCGIGEFCPKAFALKGYSGAQVDHAVAEPGAEARAQNAMRSRHVGFIHSPKGIAVLTVNDLVRYLFSIT